VSTCFEIKSSAGNYSVSIRGGLFEEALRKHERDVLLVDEWFAPTLASSGFRTITLKAEEEMKSLDEISGFITQLRRYGANRDNHLLAIGGGVIQDIAGFVASIYMRGIPWTYVPTTLLAMTDSCIGGKSSINVGPYKNLVGTFHPPSKVLLDPTLASTLSVEQRVSGLIEACKICYCRGAESFREYLDLQPASSMPPERIEQVVQLSLASKKWFIEVDEFDRAERLLLNFGHTFGHAIEGASHFRISHGVAVGVGVLCALRLGELLGRHYGQAPRVHALGAHFRTLLGEVSGLGEELAATSVSDLLDRFAADKKHRSDKYSVIVVNDSGEVELLRVPKESDFVQLVESAVTDVVGSYSVPVADKSL